MSITVGWTAFGAEDTTFNGFYELIGTHNGKYYYVYFGEAGDRYLYWYVGNNTWQISYNLISIWFEGTGDVLPANPWTPVGGWPEQIPPTLSEYWIDASLSPPRSVEYTPVSDMIVKSLKLTVWVYNASSQIQCAIYKDSDNTLLATSINSVVGNPTGGPIVIYSHFEPYPTILNGETYYLTAWSDLEDGVEIGIEPIPLDGYDLTTAVPLVYNNWPDPIVAPDDFIAANQHYMIELGDAAISPYVADVILQTSNVLVYFGDVDLQDTYNKIYYADIDVGVYDIIYDADVYLDYFFLLYEGDIYLTKLNVNIIYFGDIYIFGKSINYYADIKLVYDKDLVYYADIYIGGAAYYYGDTRTVQADNVFLPAILNVSFSQDYFIVLDTKESRPSYVSWLVIQNDKESDPPTANDITVEYLNDLSAYIYVYNPVPTGDAVIS